MERIEITKILGNQKLFFQTGNTIDVNFRIEMLKKLKEAILKFQPRIEEALYLDLGKSSSESYMTEIGMVLSELNYMLKNVKKFSKPKRVKTPLAQFHSKSFTVSNPYGNVLIISPWNYPFLLTMDPLIASISAGNTTIIKPSAYSKNTSLVIKEILDSCFNEEYVATVLGGRNENNELLKQKFDFIFFTGSGEVGKIVLENAAKNLTPTVLELGGKSPVIVDETADIKLAARRIIFGKIINSGQTCVAPDYIICDEKIKDELVCNLIQEIKNQLGEKPLDNANYPHIINKKHFDRLLGLIDKDKVSFGGNYNEETLQIEPTVLDNITFGDKVMLEEIFGPILPVITYQKFMEVYDELKELPKPLALYLFSNEKTRINFVLNHFRYGGGCINDTIIHLATNNMPFGGVGESGMGSYHGEDSFLTFSHQKSIVDKKTWIDLPLRYQPYTEKKDKLIKKFLK